MSYLGVKDAKRARTERSVWSSVAAAAAAAAAARVQLHAVAAPAASTTTSEPSATTSAAETTAFIPCLMKRLPDDKLDAAVKHSVEVNPNNAPSGAALSALHRATGGHGPSFLAAVAKGTERHWSPGMQLSVSFIDTPTPPLQLQERIVSHMNAWRNVCNVGFVLIAPSTTHVADVRVSLKYEGYWSYVGNYIHQVPANEPTMNLQGFSMSTSESEFRRVVRHEAGHTLGFVHEHMRSELVDRIDKDAAIKYFMRWQGWSREDVENQVLTALDYSILDFTSKPDETSIMCYPLPAEIMTDKKPIPGGTDIDAMDRAFAAHVYPYP